MILTPNFYGRKQFYSYFQNPGKNSVCMPFRFHETVIDTAAQYWELKAES